MSQRLNLTCPINPLSYGIVSINVLKSLTEMGVEVSLFPIGKAQSDISYKPVIEQALRNREKFDYNAPSLRIWHQFDMAQHVGCGLHCGFPIFELEDFTDIEEHHLAYLDKIFVTSRWAKTVVCNNVANADVYVAPLGVDREIFYPVEQNPSDKVVFLNIGKWEVRKGHNHLIEAFSRAFDDTDNVELWMMCDNLFCNQQQKAEWEQLYLSHPKVKLIPRVETQREVAAIMNQADVGVFPAHAEGWNLEALEMMSCGKHIVITNCSAHTEFCDNKNSRLIEMGPLEEAWDGVWFNNQGRWASFGDNQMEQLIVHMRDLYSSGQAKETNTCGISTSERFQWKFTAQAIYTGMQA